MGHSRSRWLNPDHSEHMGKDRSAGGYTPAFSHQEIDTLLRQFIESQAEADSSRGFRPPKFADYYVSNTNVATDTDTSLSWVFGGGEALFDLATPTAPKALAAGTYAIAASVSHGGATGAAASVVYATLNIDTTGYPAQNRVSAPLDGPGGHPGPALTWWCPKGGTLSLQVRHNDTGSNTFAASIYVTFWPAE